MTSANGPNPIDCNPESKSTGLHTGWHVFGDTSRLQQPFDAAVVMPSVARASVLKAVESVFTQKDVERIQLLIGIDKLLGDINSLISLLRNSPDHVTTCLFHPGYSTSVRHGGLHDARDGGVLRSTLTHLANASKIAYLDDDNWWADHHVSDLLAAIKNHLWAFSLRWFVEPDQLEPVCIDRWESVGPDLGIFREKFGGFVDPNCLMIDKLACWRCVSLWNHPVKGDPVGMSADRNVFNYLRNLSAPGQTGKASAYYVMNPNDEIHASRIKIIRDLYARQNASTPPAGRGHEPA